MWALPRRARLQPSRTNERSFFLELEAQTAVIDLNFSDAAAVDCTAGLGLTVWKFVLSHKPQVAELGLEQDNATASTPVTHGDQGAETECQGAETECQGDEDNEGEDEVQDVAKVEDTFEVQDVDTEDDGDEHEHDNGMYDDEDEEHADENDVETLKMASLDSDCSTRAPQVVNLSELEAASSTHDLPPALSALLSAERSARKMLLLKDSSHEWETESDMTEWSSVADDDECHSNLGSRRSHRSTRWRAIGYGRYARS